MWESWTFVPNFKLPLLLTSVTLDINVKHKATHDNLTHSVIIFGSDNWSVFFYLTTRVPRWFGCTLAWHNCPCQGLGRVWVWSQSPRGQASVVQGWGTNHSQRWLWHPVGRNPPLFVPRQSGTGGRRGLYSPVWGCGMHSFAPDPR